MRVDVDIYVGDVSADHRAALVLLVVRLEPRCAPARLGTLAADSALGSPESSQDTPEL